MVIPSKLRLLKAKFHYAVLVVDRSEAGIWPITSSDLARASRSATSLGPVCDQDSVTEFGLYSLLLSATKREISQLIVENFSRGRD